MKPHTVTFTIADKPDCSSANIRIDFNPPAIDGEQNTPALQAAKLIVQALNREGTSSDVTLEGGPIR